MAHHKLILEEESNENYTLISIHCSEEPYKLAYLLNKHLPIQLKRKPADLDYSNKGLEVTFPLFEYEDKLVQSVYHLVSNKCTSAIAKMYSSGGLFDDIESEKTITTYLMREFKNVDFFLKIKNEYKQVSIKKLISGISSRLCCTHKLCGRARRSASASISR